MDTLDGCKDTMPRKEISARRAYNNAYHEAHRSERNAAERARRSQKRELIRAQNRAYYLANLEQEHARNARYNAAHPEVVNARSARHRSVQASAPINDFTAAQWKDMQAHYKHCCVYCGKRAKGKLTQDHITPLAKGGNHTKANIVPACKSCNSRKHTNAPPVPVQPLLL